MMMKKNLAIALACCAIACVIGLAGCTQPASSSDSSVDSSVESSSASSQEASTAQKKLQEGLDYWFGINGAEFDMAKARDAFLEAANGGEADGWYWLGVLRMHDIDAERWVQGMSYFEKAAEEGSTLGLCGQALLHDTGFGVQKDTEKAVELYQQAADAGDQYANVNLAYKYARGKGVEPDPEKAMQMLEQAAQSDDFLVANSALMELGSIYRDGIGVFSDADKAIEYFQKASDNGFAQASHRLANMYMTGDGIDADNAKAKEYYEKEAAGGWYYNLALYYADSEPADYKAAAELCQKDAEGGKDRAMAMCLLAYMTAMGEGVEQDTDAAVDWAHMALDAIGPYDDTSDDMTVNPTLYAHYILQSLGAE